MSPPAPTSMPAPSAAAKAIFRQHNRTNLIQPLVDDKPARAHQDACSHCCSQGNLLPAAQTAQVLRHFYTQFTRPRLRIFYNCLKGLGVQPSEIYIYLYNSIRYVICSVQPQAVWPGVPWPAFTTERPQWIGGHFNSSNQVRTHLNKKRKCGTRFHSRYLVMNLQPHWSP